MAWPASRVRFAASAVPMKLALERFLPRLKDAAQRIRAGFLGQPAGNSHGELRLFDTPRERLLIFAAQNSAARPGPGARRPESPMPDEITAYRALALQLTCHAVNDCPDRSSARSEDGGRTSSASMRAVGGSKAFLGRDLRLVVLPEYLLTSYPLGETLQGWADKAAHRRGRTGVRRARGHRRAVTTSFWPATPTRPTGISGSLLPGELLCRALRRGRPALPPAGLHVRPDAARRVGPLSRRLWPRRRLSRRPIRQIGRLAAIASEEILYPEIARALALRGAEVLLHSSSEVGSPRTDAQGHCQARARPREPVLRRLRRTRPASPASDMPFASADGMSKIVDYLGDVRAEAFPGESANACAEIDLAALRRYRRRGGMGNLLSRQRLELFAATYAGSVYPPNTMLGPDGRPLLDPTAAISSPRSAPSIERLERGTG
jgi:deaminated glutathione amidase